MRMRNEKILCVAAVLVLGVLAHAKYVEVSTAPPTRGPNMAQKKLIEERVAKERQNNYADKTTVREEQD